ncbi:DGQHR domain-containing protein [Providencia huaxiensis]|uniref:DGQHR domain-containing protein n=1 Tax=Providencia huaxiensis TaxID=2027290 RepID=UPI0034E47D1A
MSQTDDYEVKSFTFSLITQGEHKFYSLTLGSDILAETCFVTSRYDDPVEGFQRLLDLERAQEIANYIDEGFGTIPNSVVLSAQPEAELTIKKGGRALTIKLHPKAFLVLDGQHRVWGYKLAKSKLRVPVVIYTGLTKKEETRLFIDINTKQRPVPNELLLDIKELAEMDSDPERIYRELFNIFQKNKFSVLNGLLSPSERKKGKISRVTFNASFSSVLNILENKSTEELFSIFNAYLSAMFKIFEDIGCKDELLNSMVFRGVISFFPEVASRVKYKYNSEYTSDNFSEVLQPVALMINKNTIVKNRSSYKKLVEILNGYLTKNFQL